MKVKRFLEFNLIYRGTTFDNLKRIQVETRLMSISM